MRWFCLVALVGLTACQVTTTTPDLAVVAVGCRQPSACYSPSTCDCTRASVGPGGNCISCDPTTVPIILQCDCSMIPGTECLEPNQVCVGRGTVCPGAGARCLPVGGDCSMGGGDPPTLAGDPDGGIDIEPRCAFVDDVCCPGTVTGPDLSVPDLGGVD
jgi:hypothetical protein